MALKPRDPVVKQHGPRCSMCIARDRMTPDETAVLEGWIADLRYTHDLIVQYLAEGGYPDVAENAVMAHRRGGCWHMRHAR